MDTLYGITIIADSDGYLDIHEGEVKVSSETDNYVFLEDSKGYFEHAYPFCFRKVIMKEELNHLLVHKKYNEIEINLVGDGAKKDTIKKKAINAMHEEIENATKLIQSWTNKLWNEVK